MLGASLYVDIGERGGSPGIFRRTDHPHGEAVQPSASALSLSGRMGRHRGAAVTLVVTRLGTESHSFKVGTYVLRGTILIPKRQGHSSRGQVGTGIHIAVSGVASWG